MFEKKKKMDVCGIDKDKKNKKKYKKKRQKTEQHLNNRESQEGFNIDKNIWWYF